MKAERVALYLLALIDHVIRMPSPRKTINEKMGCILEPQLDSSMLLSLLLPSHPPKLILPLSFP